MPSFCVSVLFVISSTYSVKRDYLICDIKITFFYIQDFVSGSFIWVHQFVSRT